LSKTNISSILLPHMMASDLTHTRERYVRVIEKEDE
jgi:hypothetical protein